MHNQEGGVELSLDDHEASTELYEAGEHRKRVLGRLWRNEYVLLRCDDGKQTSFGRVDRDRGGGAGGRSCARCRSHRDDVWSIKPRNKEQLFALDALLDDSVQAGHAGGQGRHGQDACWAWPRGCARSPTSKSITSCWSPGRSSRWGATSGILPGTLEEKLGPWMRPIFDNVEFLMGLSRADKRAGRGADELVDMGIIEIEALTYIRGRSLPHQFIIIDEAQNLTPHEAKTILTRVGEGTKIVLTGDPYQIDNPYVDIQSNGLTYVLERFKGQASAATITLTRGERSELAELAANLL